MPSPSSIAPDNPRLATPPGICAQCGRERDWLSKNRRAIGGYSWECRRCDYEATTRWRAANRDRHKTYYKWYNRHRHEQTYTYERGREANLKRKGLTPTDVTIMEQAHAGRCASCGDIPARMVIDHCHSSRRVRGLLCQHCNTALGHLREDADRILKLLDYLRRTKDTDWRGCGAS